MSLRWHECITVVLSVAHGVWGMMLLGGMVTGWLTWLPLVFGAWLIVVVFTDRDEHKRSGPRPRDEQPRRGERM